MRLLHYNLCYNFLCYPTVVISCYQASFNLFCKSADLWKSSRPCFLSICCSTSGRSTPRTWSTSSGRGWARPSGPNNRSSGICSNEQATGNFLKGQSLEIERNILFLDGWWLIIRWASDSVWNYSLLLSFKFEHVLQRLPHGMLIVACCERIQVTLRQISLKVSEGVFNPLTIPQGTLATFVHAGYFVRVHCSSAPYKVQELYLSHCLVVWLGHNFCLLLSFPLYPWRSLFGTLDTGQRTMKSIEK